MIEPISVDEQMNKAFEKAVSHTLENLGKSVHSAVLFHLEKVQGLSTEKILSNPKVFSQALEKIFSGGATIIEDKVLQEMSRELGVEFERTQGTLDEKLNLLRGAAGRRAQLLLN